MQCSSAGHTHRRCDVAVLCLLCMLFLIMLMGSAALKFRYFQRWRLPCAVAVLGLHAVSYH